MANLFRIMVMRITRIIAPMIKKLLWVFVEKPNNHMVVVVVVVVFWGLVSKTNLIYGLERENWIKFGMEIQ